MKKKNVLHKARGTKRCSAYSHPCTVLLHRCSDASAGPNTPAFVASGQWPCMEIFSFLQPESVSNTISAARVDVYSYCMLSQ